MEALISFCFIFATIFAIFILNLFILRLKALKYKANISFSQIIGMTLKKIPPKIIVDAQILCCKAGIPVETNLFEAHYLAGGNVHRVIQALIEVQRSNTKLNFKEAAATDLALAVIEKREETTSTRVQEKKTFGFKLATSITLTLPFVEIIIWCNINGLHRDGDLGTLLQACLNFLIAVFAIAYSLSAYNSLFTKEKHSTAALVFSLPYILFFTFWLLGTLFIPTPEQFLYAVPIAIAYILMLWMLIFKRT